MYCDAVSFEIDIIRRGHGDGPPLDAAAELAAGLELHLVQYKSAHAERHLVAAHDVERAAAAFPLDVEIFSRNRQHLLADGVALRARRRRQGVFWWGLRLELRS